MNSYLVKIKNDDEWAFAGAINREFVVFAEDITDAIMESQDELHVLMSELEANHIGLAGVRIVSIYEQTEVIGNKSRRLLEGWTHSDSKEEPAAWAKKIAARIAKDK